MLLLTPKINNNHRFKIINNFNIMVINYNDGKDYYKILIIIICENTNF